MRDAENPQRKASERLLAFLMENIRDMDNASFSSARYRTSQQKLGFAHATTIITEHIVLKRLPNGVNFVELPNSQLKRLIDDALVQVFKDSDMDFVLLAKSHKLAPEEKTAEAEATSPPHSNRSSAISISPGSGVTFTSPVPVVPPRPQSRTWVAAVSPPQSNQTAANEIAASSPVHADKHSSPASSLSPSQQSTGVPAAAAPRKQRCCSVM